MKKQLLSGLMLVFALILSTSCSKEENTTPERKLMTFEYTYTVAIPQSTLDVVDVLIYYTNEKGEVKIKQIEKAGKPAPIPTSGYNTSTPIDKVITEASEVITFATSSKSRLCLGAYIQFKRKSSVPPPTQDYELQFAHYASFKHTLDSTEIYAPITNIPENRMLILEKEDGEMLWFNAEGYLYKTFTVYQDKLQYTPGVIWTEK